MRDCYCYITTFTSIIVMSFGLFYLDSLIMKHHQLFLYAIILLFICVLAVLAWCITYITYCFTLNISNPNLSEMENPTPIIVYRANEYGNVDLESHYIQEIMPAKIKELPTSFSECVVNEKTRG